MIKLMFAVVGVVDVVCVHYNPFILGKTAKGYLLLDNCGTNFELNTFVRYAEIFYDHRKSG